MILGIDISDHQKFVDYGRLTSAGVEYGYVKHSQSPWLQKRYTEHINGLKNAGIPTGAYNYIDERGGDQRVALKPFIEEALSLELPPVYDIERWALTRPVVDQVVKAHTATTNEPMVIYTGIWQWRKFGVPLPFGSKLMLASYPRSVITGKGPLTQLTANDDILGKVERYLSGRTLPTIKGAELKFWQFDDKAIGPTFGTHPIDSKSLDLQVYFGSKEELLGKEQPKKKEKPTLRIATKGRLNVRRSPGGMLSRTLSAGEIMDIYEERPAVYKNTVYNWGRLVSGEWIALGRRGTRTMVDVISELVMEYNAAVSASPIDISLIEASDLEEAKKKASEMGEYYHVWKP